MQVNSFKDLMQKALHPKEHILTKNDVDYLDRPPSEFLRLAGVYDTRKIDKISIDTLMGAYRDVSIVYKKHAKDICPQALDAYLRFLKKVEFYLRFVRKVPDWKIDALFKKESNYRRYF